MSASQVILRAYHRNGIFSIPMATTPAADPIIRSDPPTPAQNVSRCQNRPSSIKSDAQDGSADAAIMESVITGYMFMQAATRGTLSMIEDSAPIIPLMMYG